MSSPIQLFAPASLPAIDLQETARYLGYGTNTPDEKTAHRIKDCAADMQGAANPRAAFGLFDIEVSETAVRLRGTSLTLPGRDLAAHLKGCRQAVLLAATLSASADRLIRVTGLRDMTAGLIMDCCATTAIEQFCDIVESEIRHRYPAAYYTTRYSPGYGDLPLTVQSEWLSVLMASKLVGLSATDSSILTPRKSVTAIIGLSDNKPPNSKTGCDCCSLRDTCAFRRKGEFCGLSNASD